MGKVLEPVTSERTHRHSFRQAVLDQGPGGPGDQDLPAMGRGRDPGRSMDLDPDVLVAARDALAGVEPHPDAKRARLWQCGELPQGPHRRGRRGGGALEHGEE